jgi:hypothetical protein
MKTIFVLGLGESLKFFRDFDSPKIGVNDIWQVVETECVVCIDEPLKFTSSRLAVIKSCNPKIFYSPLEDWRPFKKSSHYWKMPTRGIAQGEVFKENLIYHSVNSPFVACNIAYLLGAEEIVMYGVDFLSHSKLKGAFIMERIIKDFTWLNDAFKARGVKLFVGHGASRLSEILPVWYHKNDLGSRQATPYQDIASY